MRIVIADSHTLCREALCAYIRHAEPDFSVGEADSLQALQTCILAGASDVLLVERNLPGLEEENICGLARRKNIKVGLMVSDIAEAESIDPNIMGIFPKTLSCKEFLEGLKEMRADKKFYPKTRNETAVETTMPFKHPRKDFNLTNREREVLIYLTKGASNKDIGRALDLQVVTIKLHVRGICRKMKAQNRTQAALTAIENGWG